MPPFKERRTRRSFSLRSCSIFHIPLRKRSVRRSGAAPDPRRCRGAGDRSVKTIRLKSRGLHRASGTNHGEVWRQRIRAVRARFASAARVKQTIGRIRAGSYHAPLRQSLPSSFLGAPPAFFQPVFSGKIFRRVCAESCAQLQRLHRHPPGGGGTLFRQRSPSAVSFLVARSCIASCAALDRLTRFQRQYAYSG